MSRIKSWFRELVGWSIATGYILSGARSRALKRCASGETILPIVGHDPDPKLFRALIRWFKGRGFSFVSADEMLAIVRGEQPCRPKLAWLSFDDGWRSFSSSVLKILEEEQVPATLFIAPRETEIGELWADSITESVGHGEVVKMYSWPLDERENKVREILSGRIRPRQLLTREEVVALARHPLVTIENHTNSHLSCSHRPTEEVVEEARTAAAELRSWIGRKTELCCYPFGHRTPATDAALNKAGFLPATLLPGMIAKGQTALRRNLFKDRFSLRENIGRILGAWVAVHVADND